MTLRSFSSDKEKLVSRDNEKRDPKLLRWFILLLFSAWVSERRQQRKLVCLPLVLRQQTDRNDALCSLMTAVFIRRLRQKLLGRTRALINSSLLKPTRAVFPGHTLNETINDERCAVQVEWTFPESTSDKVRKKALRSPVVVIVPDPTASISVTRQQHSLTRVCVEYGWTAALLRDTLDVQPNHTDPDERLRSGIRFFVKHLCCSSDFPRDSQVFLVGYSMGANAILKYLDEEGLANSTPNCVAGAVIVNYSFDVTESSIEQKNMAKRKTGITTLSIGIPTMVLCLDNYQSHYERVGGAIQACLSNPNVILVGHTKAKIFNWIYAERLCMSKSEVKFVTWSDYAATKFIDAVRRISRCSGALANEEPHANKAKIHCRL